MRNGTLPRIPAESKLADGADTLKTPVVTIQLATVRVDRGSSKPISCACACAFENKDRLAESKSRIKSLVISDGREEKMSTKKNQVQGMAGDGGFFLRVQRITTRPPIINVPPTSWAGRIGSPSTKNPLTSAINGTRFPKAAV